MSGMNDGIIIQEARTPVMTSSTKTDAPPELTLEPKKNNRCGCCSKKLLLSDIGCAKCGTRHCGAHRLPELHACPHDFRKEGQALLAKQNPRVVGDKVERI
jgi:predicted nucleic acid binding AN1-type Zn finger protein